MKRFFLIGFFLLVLSLVGFSQTEKNTFLIGGNGSIEFPKNNLEIRINPNVGKFIADRFCIGITLPMVYTDSDLFFDFSPFARYYYGVSEKRSYYLSGALELKNIFNLDHTLTYNKVVVGLGHSWFLNRSVGFEIEMQGRTDFEGIDLGMIMGFQIYLNNSKK